MDFLEYSKISEFSILSGNHKKLFMPKTKILKRWHIFLERVLRYLEGPRTIIGHFGTRRIFYGHQNDENSQMRISKNAILDKHISTDLDSYTCRNKLCFH